MTTTRELLAFGRDRYAESFRDSFAYLAQQRNWPKAQYRALLRFFREETTPTYWRQLPPEEGAAQITQWVLAEHPNAPAQLWAGLDVFGQANAALAWLDAQPEKGGVAAADTAPTGREGY
jgi:beta-xylosidase